MKIPLKLKLVGCKDMSTYIMYRCEPIYIQNGKYYPTIASGYKDAACCSTLQDAQRFIDNCKYKK